MTFGACILIMDAHETDYINDRLGAPSGMEINMNNSGTMIQNPILPGFNPDPSMIRAGDDYFLVTSTFEWFPAIPLYHSKDLVHWRLARNLLEQKRYLDLTGVPPSKGVWAPALSYCEKQKRFYLVYSNVHAKNNATFDVDNYLIWTDDVYGEWQGPVYLNSSGFDPSIFHDDDGRKWMINKDRDFRPGNEDNRSIVIQEIDVENIKLTGSPTHISYGATRRGFVEGAHIYKRGGYYYLMAAEGGTGYGHCVTLSRSVSVTGPYEPCPHNPVITSAPADFSASEENPFMMPELYNPDLILQKSGHGSLVETQNGEWYIAHLCGRPVMPQKACILGRETAIQRVEWTQDGWLRMADGSNLAKDKTPAPKLPSHPFPEESSIETFADGLSPHFITVRNEITPDWAEVRGGGLYIRGQESLMSNYNVGLIARRLTAFNARVTAKLDFVPEHYHHLAGITCYYDSGSHYCAYKTWDEKRGTVLTWYKFFGGRMTGYLDMTNIPANAPVWLRAEIDGCAMRFLYSLDGESFLPLGPAHDMTILSDEAESPGLFTGTFIGMFAQDSHTREKWAKFQSFEYMVI